MGNILIQLKSLTMQCWLLKT